MSALPENILRRMDKSERAKLGKGGRTADEANAVCEAGKERTFQKLVANWLRLNGFMFIQSRADKKTTNGAGVPDFLIIMHGREVLPVEVKTETGNLNSDQEQWHLDYYTHSRGSHVVIIRSLRDLQAALKLEFETLWPSP